MAFGHPAGAASCVLAEAGEFAVAVGEDADVLCWAAGSVIGEFADRDLDAPWSEWPGEPAPLLDVDASGGMEPIVLCDGTVGP